jgi:hypothetical protein
MKTNLLPAFFIVLFSVSVAHAQEKDSLDLKVLIEGNVNLYYSNVDYQYYVSKADVNPTKVSSTYTGRFFEYFMRDCKQIPKSAFRKIQYERYSLEKICRRYNDCDQLTPTAASDLQHEKLYEIRFGVKAGANFSRMHFTSESEFYTDEKLSFETGYAAGFTILSVVDKFSFEVELLLLQQSGEMTTPHYFFDFDYYTALDFTVLQLGFSPGYTIHQYDKGVLTLQAHLGVARELASEQSYLTINPDNTRSERFTTNLSVKANKLAIGGGLKVDRQIGKNHLATLAIRYQAERFDTATNGKLLHLSGHSLISTLGFYF